MAAVVVASAAVIQLGVAQVSVDVSDCVELTKPEDRLACFEAQVEAARDAPPAQRAPGAGGTAAGGSASSGRDAESRSETQEDIVAKVTELRETVPQAYLITLDNGQVWRQTVPEFYPLRQGSDVRIYVSRWRAYRLTSPVLRGHIQVERVR
jgi:hypothetical protein